MVDVAGTKLQADKAVDFWTNGRPSKEGSQ